MAMKYPCAECEVRKTYAKLFDVHFFGEDCPQRCEEYEAWCKECDEDTGDGIGQAFSPD